MEIININKRGRYSILKIRDLIKNEKPDICFATLPQIYKAVLFGHFLSRSNSKVIFRESAHRDKARISFMNFYFLKLVYKYSDYNVALTTSLKNQLIKEYDIAENKIKLIYNSVDINYIQNKINKKPNEIDENMFNLISVGRLTKQKNYSMLIKAFKIVYEKGYRNIKLNILGTGSLKNELLNLIEKYNLKDNIKLLGFKNNPFNYMAYSDLFILSSLYEGMPNVLLESLACKTPVLSTNCPTGPKEILGENQYGCLVENNNEQEMAEKIITLYNNSALLKNKKKSGVRRSQDFDINKIISEYEDFFQNIV